MDITDLQIDLSKFRTPIVIWEKEMFVPDDAIYTNNVGFLQTEEDVFFTGTVFYPWGWLQEYKEGLKDGRCIVFHTDEGIILSEEIYIEGGFIAWLDAEGKVLKGKIFNKKSFITWLNSEGNMLKDKCFKANNFEDKDII
jgi:hypothetical protein